MKRSISALFGCSGTVLTDWERDFFRDVRPWGLIIFGRNIETPEQLRHLTDSFRNAADDPDAMVFVDQEGGLVARLRGPHFRHPPAPRRFAEHYKHDPEVACEAAWLNAQLMAQEMRKVGINANFAPMIDVVRPSAHEFLQERALGDHADAVIDLGKATALGLRDGGVAPVIKHAPGHGLAQADSHLEQPCVQCTLDDLECTDFLPFISLKKEAMLMTAHVVYDAIDPDRPGTTSKIVVTDLIRQRWGYDGLIITDDLNMKALDGSLEERSKEALDAGCDILCHCNGDSNDMEAVARAAVPLDEATKTRADRARMIAHAVPKPFDTDEAIARLKALHLYEAKNA